MTAAPIRILFVCTGNSVRSQMAEGFAKTLAADHVWVESAGTHPFGLSRTAVDVMAESGIDISRHKSKSLDRVERDPDFAITLCDDAACIVPAVLRPANVLHWATMDPGGCDGPADPLARYRLIRDDLRKKVETFLTEHRLLKNTCSISLSPAVERCSDGCSCDRIHE
jgi:arsenate reductase